MESVQKQLDRSLVFNIDVNEVAPLVAYAGMTASFTSSNPSVAEISVDGMLIGRAPGTTSITVVDGNREDTFEISVSAETGISTLSQLRPHPRIRFTQESLEIRKQFRKGAHAAAYAEVVAEADALLDETAIAYEFEFGNIPYSYSLAHPPAQPAIQIQPDGFTDYPFWTRLSRQIEQRLSHLSLAWSLTGDQRYGNRAVEILIGICNWDKWHEYDKATNNLSLPHFTIAAALAYDELFELFADDERAHVRDAIVRLGLRPMAYWFDRKLDHNIAVLMNVGMLYGALAIGDETPFVEKYLTKSVEMLSWYLRQRESSTVTEGLVYTSYAMSTLLDAGTALRHSIDRDELLNSPYIANELAAFFAFQFAGDGGFANLADSSSDIQPRSLMAKLSNELRDPFAGWLIQREDLTMAKLLDLPETLNQIDTNSTSKFPLDRHFDRIDWVALRSGWTGQDSVAVFVSSPSAVGHNHFDQNHFVLAVNGEWLLTDPGYQNYSPGPEAFFTNDSTGHNALLVNGVGQSIRGHGRVVSTRFDPGFATVTGDATASYEGRIDRWFRTLIFARDRYMLVIDDLAASTASDEIALLFHSTSPIFKQGEGLALGPVDDLEPAFTIKGEKALLDLRFWSDSVGSIAHRTFDGAERFGTWIEYELSGATKYRVVSLLNWDSSDTDLEVRTSGSNALEIQIGNDVHRVESVNSEGVSTSSLVAARP